MPTNRQLVCCITSPLGSQKTLLSPMVYTSLQIKTHLLKDGEASWVLGSPAQPVGEVGFFFCLRHIKSARTRGGGQATLFAIRKARSRAQRLRACMSATRDSTHRPSNAMPLPLRMSKLDPQSPPAQHACSHCGCCLLMLACQRQHGQR